MKKKRKIKVKRKARFVWMLVLFMMISSSVILLPKMISKEKKEPIKTSAEAKENIIQIQGAKGSSKEIDDWRLVLANKDHILPEDFHISLSNIDKDRQFDSRAIGDLKDMMNAMKEDGIENIWVQSAYRSIQKQKVIYERRVNEYMQQGKTREEAENLTQKKINKPGGSDHNLGLAVDFNNVENDFENLPGYQWLQRYAQEYGFVLRYPKGKEEITYVSYEPWHWRYVGQEHARVMKQKNLCLEEYIQYLKGE